MKLALIAIIAFTISPIAIPYIASKFFNIGNESNSGMAALPWMAFYTVPIGAVALVVWFGVWVMMGLWR